MLRLAFGTHKGKVGASKYWQELYDAFPDIKINPITITVAANHERIVAEIDVSGTQRGKIGGSPPFGVLRRQLNLLKI